MGHSGRHKLGPTLDEAAARGVTHIAVHCHELNCLHKANVELVDIKAPRNTAVNRLPFRCGKCRGINVSLGLVTPKQPVTPLPLMELDRVKPK